MADETKQVEETGEVAETTEAQETAQPTTEELMQKLEEFNKLEETRKNEIAGLNKAISTQKNAYDELLAKTETEAETKAREAKEANERAEQERNDFLNQKAEFAKQENDFNVKVKALELGFTAEDIETLGFQNVESVERYKTFLDSKIEATKEKQTETIETALSGSRENYTSNKSEVIYPNAIDRAFR